MSDTERFNERAATWDEDPENVARASAVAAVVREALPLRDDMNAIEIGGGTGLLGRALVDDLDTVVVTDVAPGMVQAAAKALDDSSYDGWEARLYDIEHDPLPDEQFDLVLGQLTLHHMGDVAAVISQCTKLLRPGGWVALVDLDHDPEGDFHASVPDFHGHDGFTRKAIEQWLSDAGLVEVAVGDAGTVTKEIDSVEREFPLFLATGRLP